MSEIRSKLFYFYYFFGKIKKKISKVDWKVKLRMDSKVKSKQKINMQIK